MPWSSLFPRPQKRGQIHLHIRKVILHRLLRAASSDYHLHLQMFLWMIRSHGMTTKLRDTTRLTQPMMAMESMGLASNQLRPLRGHVLRNDSGKLPNGSPARHEKLVRNDEKEGMKALEWTDSAAYTKALSRNESNSVSRTDPERLLSTTILQHSIGIFEEHGARSKMGINLSNMIIWRYDTQI